MTGVLISVSFGISAAPAKTYTSSAKDLALHRTTTNSPSTGESCSVKYRTALRKPIHRIAFRRCNIRGHMPFASGVSGT